MSSISLGGSIYIIYFIFKLANPPITTYTCVCVLNIVTIVYYDIIYYFRRFFLPKPLLGIHWKQWNKKVKTKKIEKSRKKKHFLIFYCSQPFIYKSER